MATDDFKMIEFYVAYHPSPYPHAMRDDLNEIAQVCDGIYIPFTESDLHYAPRRIKACVELAHDANLIAIADLWGAGNLFASPAVPSIYTIQHPDQNCVSNRGRVVPKTCPRSSSFRAYMRGLITELIVKYEFDGLFWDEPSWSLNKYFGRLEEGEWLCCCESCKTAFRERFGSDMPSRITPEVAQLRDEAILSLLAELCTLVKKGGEHLITATCVTPSDSIEFKVGVARTPNLDILGIDPYWRPDMDVSQRAYIDEHTGETVSIARANGKLVESWVSANDQWSQHERDPYRAAKLMAAHDIDQISAWAYRDYQSGGGIDKPNWGDPELVWQNLSQAYREIREGDLEIHA